MSTEVIIQSNAATEVTLSNGSRTEVGLLNGNQTDVGVLNGHQTTLIMGAVLVGVGGSGDLTYLHDQMVPSASWVVIHNLGKYPAVAVHDSSGNEVEGHVKHDSVNQATLTFSAAFSGKATFN